MSEAECTMDIYQSTLSALSAPFPPESIGWLPKGGRQLAYITARQVMNRLDEVVGPSNWEDTYEPFGKDGIKCVLSVRFPDGVGVAKCGIGGAAAMDDAADAEASGESHALKRAAVKFGIGRYLYGDGVPRFCGDAPVPTPTGNGYRPSPQSPQRAPVQQPMRQESAIAGRPTKLTLPDPGRAYGWAKRIEELFGVNVLNGMVRAAREIGYPENTKNWDADMTHELCMRAVNMIRDRKDYRGEFDHLFQEEGAGDSNEPPW